MTRTCDQPERLATSAQNVNDIKRDYSKQKLQIHYNSVQLSLGIDHGRSLEFEDFALQIQLGQKH